MTRIVLHIDRLVLNGFDGHDRHAIADGIRNELARRLAEAATVDQWIAQGNIDHRAGQIELRDALTTRALGARIADAIAPSRRGRS